MKKPFGNFQKGANLTPLCQSFQGGLKMKTNLQVHFRINRF